MTDAYRNDQNRPDGWYFAVSLFFLSSMLFVKTIMEVLGHSHPKLISAMGPLPTLLVFGGLVVLGATWFLRGSVTWPFRKVLALVLLALPLSGLLALMQASGDGFEWGGFAGAKLSSVLPKGSVVFAWGLALVLNLATLVMAVRLAFLAPQDVDSGLSNGMFDALNRRPEVDTFRMGRAEALRDAATKAPPAAAAAAEEALAVAVPAEERFLEAEAEDTAEVQDDLEVAFYRPSFVVAEEDEEEIAPPVPLKAHEDPRRILAGVLKEELPLEAMEPVADLMDEDDGYYSSEEMEARYARIQARELGMSGASAQDALASTTSPKPLAENLDNDEEIIDEASTPPWIRSVLAPSAETPNLASDADSDVFGAGLGLTDSERVASGAITSVAAQDLVEQEEDEEEWEEEEELEDEEALLDEEPDEDEDEDEDEDDWDEDEEDDEDDEDYEEEDEDEEDLLDDQDSDELDDAEDEELEDEELEDEEEEDDADEELEVAATLVDGEDEEPELEPAAEAEGPTLRPGVVTFVPRMEVEPAEASEEIEVASAPASRTPPPLFPSVMTSFASDRREPEAKGPARNTRARNPKASSGDTLFTHRSEVPEELYQRAVDMVLEEDRCSQAMLQRGLGINFSGAGTPIGRRSGEGKVGPPLASGRREVLLRRNESVEQAGG
ncbi:MAG TPA: DNA translocase FtsK [Planctomycetota bacterium]|nr:DNA translocase FtsK [Planctomycetota bacterium]